VLITAAFSDRLLQINPSILSLSGVSADVAVCKKEKEKKTDESLDSFNFYLTFFACFFETVSLHYLMLSLDPKLKLILKTTCVNNVSKLYDLIQEKISEKFDYQILT
jgi:hypothetical protein